MILSAGCGWPTPSRFGQERQCSPRLDRHTKRSTGRPKPTCPSLLSRHRTDAVGTAQRHHGSAGSQDSGRSAGRVRSANLRMPGFCLPRAGPGRESEWWPPASLAATTGLLGQDDVCGG